MLHVTVQNKHFKWPSSFSTIIIDLQAYGLLETAQQKCPNIFGLN